jgi:thiol-disulfide isomerase/thioredoxin
VSAGARAGRPQGRRRRLAATVLAVVSAASLLAGCSGSNDDSGSGKNFVSGEGFVTQVYTADRKAAPKVTGSVLEGGSFDLSKERGKVVVLNFWASWCAPCRAEGPALQVVALDLAKQGVVFVGVNTRDDPAAARAFLTNIHSAYLNINDSDGQVALAFHGTLPPDAIPSTIVIDRQGRIAARIVGPTTEPRLRALLAPLATQV